MSSEYEGTAGGSAIRFDVHVAANEAVGIQSGSLLEDGT
jgi:hypothetical protein